MVVVIYQLQIWVPYPVSIIKAVIYVFGLVGIGIATYVVVYKTCQLITCHYKKTRVG
jgi:hypothetical protein